MRFTGVKALLTFIRTLEGLGFKPSIVVYEGAYKKIKVYEIKRWLYEQYLYLSQLGCDIININNGLVIQFHNQKNVVMEITFIYEA